MRGGRTPIEVGVSLDTSPQKLKSGNVAYDWCGVPIQNQAWTFKIIYVRNIIMNIKQVIEHLEANPNSTVSSKSINYYAQNLASLLHWMVASSDGPKLQRKSRREIKTAKDWEIDRE